MRDAFLHELASNAPYPTLVAEAAVDEPPPVGDGQTDGQTYRDGGGGATPEISAEMSAWEDALIEAVPVPPSSLLLLQVSAGP